MPASKKTGETPLPPSPCAHTPDHAILKTRVEAMITHRKAIIQLQEALEDAWKGAVSGSQALNRPLDSQGLPESDKKNTLVEAETKRRRMEALQQSAFLIFQNITENKYEDQLKKGQELLKLLEIATESSPKALPKKVAEKTEEFLWLENNLNKEILRRFHTTRKGMTSLLAETLAIQALPCRAAKLEAHLQHDLKLLETFLISADQMLSPP